MKNMGKITYLENGRATSAKMFLIYRINDKYEAVELPKDKTPLDVLPRDVNFMRLMARNKDDAIVKAKGLYYEDLLSIPV